LDRVRPDHRPRRLQANLPAADVSWHDATAFCRWLSAKLACEVRLPSEWEWQWAAQSGRARFHYPWGNQWRQGLANTEDCGLERTLSVGLFPAGRSLQGIADLVGNVWEWCRDAAMEDVDDPSIAEPARAVRGSSCLDLAVYGLAEHRDFAPAGLRTGDLGFRVVRTPP
jgi:formylglycine-generating enzyme required for sulfatase activity